MELIVIGKNNQHKKFNKNKILSAVQKSAERLNKSLSKEQEDRLIYLVLRNIENLQITEIPVSTMHKIVEVSLDDIDKDIATSYRNYRNYKQDFVKMLDNVYKQSVQINYVRLQENANMDSALVSTKKTLVGNALGKEFYIKEFLNESEIEACEDGYIYIHDMSSRLDTMNCCLFDMDTVLSGGFEMGNRWYNEPKTLDVAFDVIGDIISSTAAQQYGGFTVPEVDKILEKYAQKSFNKYLEEYLSIVQSLLKDTDKKQQFLAKGLQYAYKKTQEECRQGYQGIEYKLNSVSSSRGDYPFVTFTFGLSKSLLGQMISKTILNVHRIGQGKDGYKTPVLFPKLVFLYDKNLHGKDKELYEVYKPALLCSSKTMYPDWLSLTGEGYVSNIYKKYRKVISPMGCRAFLSPWYERGGMYPADEKDTPIYVGRFNCGAISLHLPMIFEKSLKENKDFYEILDYYLEMIRDIHKRTKEHLARKKASINPLAFCQGGFYGGTLDLNDNIAPLLESSTFSFGITALNELQELYNNKSLVEDGKFAVEVMEHINNKLNQYKKEDHILYAVYGTPAENLCGVQIKQFRNKYGIIKKVSDRDYVSNSFHCHVTEEISPIQKQNLEKRFWDLFNGGKIQYVRYPLNYNIKAMETLILRAMDLGFYEGVNLALSFCDDCGYEQLEMEVCPKCGSKNLTKIDRMNGYLAYSRVKGESRLNDAKMSEIKERKSM
ncbi:anaerobic ribonucleoside-triphosphate reductase [Thomasclavelia ramosa]|uniref:anaerobic ribonucleoside-triphosphate reductase n=1 Tax=Thomasclavelia ramosa TaxID=1547 RepID=UPI003DA607F9